MSKLLKPERLNLDPQSPNAAKDWKYWFKTFENFIIMCGTDAPDKHLSLINLISSDVYEYVEDCTDYDSVKNTLEKFYVKSPNEVFARHLLATRRQQCSETLDVFFQNLHKLSKDCKFKAVSAEQYRDEMLRDAFINGLLSPEIRQRLLENDKLTMDSAFDKASSMDVAQRNASAYSSPVSHVAAASAPPPPPQSPPPQALESGTTELSSLAATHQRKQFKCYFCGGGSYHVRRHCPARETICGNCGIRGHNTKCCLSKKKSTSTTASLYPSLCATGITASFPPNLQNAGTSVLINGHSFIALIDSGSSDSFISQSAATQLKLQVHPSTKNISMALTTMNTTVLGYCTMDITLNNSIYRNVCLSVLKDLCSDIILGHDFQKQHKNLIFEFGGPKPDLVVSNNSTCAVSAASIGEPSLFANVSPKCKPIATKPRRFSLDDRRFIQSEVNRLMSDGVIELSTSPWRAQVVVVKSAVPSNKKRLCVDYSQTINQYTELDAYPLPRIDDMINNLAHYRVFSTFDLKSAYHQIPIKETDKHYTAFEANGNLYQFCRIPFGVTNGVAVFQRLMDKLVTDECLKDTFPYLDDITVAGRTQEEHDANVKAFYDVVHRHKLTLNDSKSVLSATSIKVLGYLIGDGIIKPDPERLRPLQELPPPSNARSLKRALGLYAYYAKWIPEFSLKIHPLVNTTEFPLSQNALDAFNTVKKELESATLNPIDETARFVVECDASDTTISATLNQGGRPVAFMSRTLQGSELHYPAVEKEATAIIEAVRKWSDFLARREFTLITDQRSVAFMLDKRKRTKIKNNKIQGWRLELAAFSYEIKYRPGPDNVGPDTLTRAFCASISNVQSSNLTDIHNQLCHPGVTRMLHFIRSKNLPYSTDDVKKVCSSCRICAELKPQFYQPLAGQLIKATKPMERWSIDFKGPLRSSTRNTYMLTIVDEYSRFPFAIPCPNMTTTNVIKCLDELFVLCGAPDYIHSDRGASFMSQELKEYFTKRGIATSKSLPYHPQGNGQCERYNGIIWKGVRLALKTQNLLDSNWEAVLPTVLHSIRSLLSTSTNTTPHERFFGFQRRSSSGSSLPSWLSVPGSVMLRRFVRHSKSDPLVDEVELTNVNPAYAHIRYQDGRESTVSLKDLSPCPVPPQQVGTPGPPQVATPAQQVVTPIPNTPVTTEDIDNGDTATEGANAPQINNDTAPDIHNFVRRSVRVTRPPPRLAYE